MKKIRAKIAILTLQYILLNKWESMSIEKISKKLIISKKKFSNLIKNKQDLLKNINHYFDDQILESSKLLDQSTSKDMILKSYLWHLEIIVSGTF